MIISFSHGGWFFRNVTPITADQTVCACASVCDVGMLRRIKQCVSVPVFVMIRPRGGDFCYSEHEMQVMKMDIEVLKEHGADGVVIGVLNRYRTKLCICYFCRLSCSSRWSKTFRSIFSKLNR